jgi:probable addiction module antidote protein
MSKQTVQVAAFDAADYLDNEEVIAEYLALAAEDETPGVFMRAVEAVAKARGMAQVAEASGLSRESLYKALAPEAHPRFDTVRRVLRALGTDVAIIPRANDRPGGVRTVPPRSSMTGVVLAKKATRSTVTGAMFTKKVAAKKSGSALGLKRAAAAGLRAAASRRR